MAHRHKAIESQSRTIGWSWCIASPHQHCDGSAHGGVVYVDYCACGAQRETER